MRYGLIMVCIWLALAGGVQAVWIENQAASSMTRTNAVMVGNILDTNGVTGALQLYLLYAKSDYGTNFTSWTYTNTYTPAVTGAVSTNVTGLLPATRYYYNWVIASTNARFWPAGSSNVVTLSGAPTGAAPAVVYHPVMESTNGALAASTNFFGMNTGRLSQAQVVLVPDLAAYATVAQGAAGTNAQARVAVVETNAASLAGFVAHTGAVGVAVHGLGSASTNATSDFATADQGAAGTNSSQRITGAIGLDVIDTTDSGDPVIATLRARSWTNTVVYAYYTPDFQTGFTASRGAEFAGSLEYVYYHFDRTRFSGALSASEIETATIYANTVTSHSVNENGTNLFQKIDAGLDGKVSTNHVGAVNLTNATVDVAEPVTGKNPVTLDFFNRNVGQNLFLYFETNYVIDGVYALGTTPPTAADVTYVATNPAAGEYIFRAEYSSTNLTSIFAGGISIGTVMRRTGNPASTAVVKWEGYVVTNGTPVTQTNLPEYAETAELYTLPDTFATTPMTLNASAPYTTNLTATQRFRVRCKLVSASGSYGNIELKVGATAISDVHLFGSVQATGGTGGGISQATLDAATNAAVNTATNASDIMAAARDVVATNWADIFSLSNRYICRLGVVGTIGCSGGVFQAANNMTLEAPTPRWYDPFNMHTSGGIVNIPKTGYWDVRSYLTLTRSNTTATVQQYGYIQDNNGNLERTDGFILAGQSVCILDQAALLYLTNGAWVRPAFYVSETGIIIYANTNTHSFTVKWAGN